MTYQLRADLVARGFSDTDIRTAVRRGEFVRLGPGRYADSAVFAALGAHEQDVVRIRAAAAKAPSLVVSHTSALTLHGLPVMASSESMHFTRPGRGGQRRTRTVHVHAAALPESAETIVDGIRVTSVPRTLVDLARTASMTSAIVAADAALNRRRLTPDELCTELRAAVSCRGHSRALRALRLVDGLSESPGESMLRLAAHDPALPTLSLQVEIFDESPRFVGRADAAYVSAGVLLEFDGHVKYDRLVRPGETVRDVVMREKRREEQLTALGWRVVRITWSELHSPATLVARLRQACVDQSPVVECGGLRGRAVPRQPLRLAL